ncbi:hypothetical protein Q4508_01160 [Amphritea sp. 2_MG-2023]|uniref:hypothetical protein n=1 Tax=Amphritea TaxID=515417 RepID=UPI001C070D6E|nr:MULTISPECIES: hypothetical protein [Amphritea]MBU2964761.1 hypothetical protein [Amphritea atlantica]MDO6417158.1 hypothetical protein [Amphritea sp. 2_MG-2023]
MNQQPQSPSAMTGWILLLMLLLALISALTHIIPGYIAGIPAWAAVALLIRQQKRNQLIQSVILLSIGVIGLTFGLLNGADNSYLFKAIEANQLVVAMLIGVSFLRIIAANNIRCNEQLPTGRKAILNTLFGSHLIAAVINMSSVMIVGDRLSARQSLTPLQGLTLLRAFSICAIWSPFFASMGVILISAPGAQLGTLMLFGLPTALIGLLLSSWQISRHPDILDTQGYPMHFKALWMPLMLAILVIIAHWRWPTLPVMTLVTLIAILFVIIYLPFKQGMNSFRLLKHHVHEGLPKLSSEVTLFLAAAVMAAGVAALLESLQIRLAPEHFTAPEACLTLLALVGLALIGMHPVTTAVLAGSILMPSVSDPNLLGITLLLSWSIGVGVSPFSGVQLSLQSRYGLPALTLMKFNRYYSPTMLAVGFAVIWFYASIGNIS